MDTRPTLHAPRSTPDAPPAPRVLLAIDTCTRRASIALRDAHTVLAESTWPCERQHTAMISARIHDLLIACQLQANDIGAVAVAIGPGSFTGVRCGLAIAKGMAVANNLPLLGVSAFQAIAYAQPNHDMPIYAVVEAGRSRVAVCRYERVEHVPLFDLALRKSTSGQSDWHIYDHKTFADQIQPNTWVCGDLPATLLAMISARAAVAPAWLNVRRAGVLADIAYARWQQGDIDDAATLTPIYPKEAA